jgi:hypothetical protein
MKRLLVILCIGVLAACQPTGSKNEAGAGTGAAGGDKLTTRIGNLSLESGYPSLESVDKLYDERDFQRACIVHNWGLPMVGFHALHLAQRDQIGVKDGEVSVFRDLNDKKGMLTPNITTVYAFCFWNLAEKGAW